jgi:hypothetical protein
MSSIWSSLGGTVGNLLSSAATAGEQRLQSLINPPNSTTGQTPTTPTSPSSLPIPQTDLWVIGGGIAALVIILIIVGRK